jgi:hypothetical protein
MKTEQCIVNPRVEYNRLMNDFRQDKEDSVLETINCELIKREG